MLICMFQFSIFLCPLGIRLMLHTFLILAVLLPAVHSISLPQCPREAWLSLGEKYAPVILDFSFPSLLVTAHCSLMIGRC